MLNFVDISNHKSDVDISVLPIDAVIVKATEDTNFVDWTCDGFVQEARRLNLPYGFYHFAGESSAESEADYFIEHTLGYFGEGIPILDWETTQTVDWVNRFVRRIHDRMNVWPWIYGNPWRFNQGGVERNCARWVASYPSHLLYPDFNADEGDPPATDGNVVAFQFASDGRLPGYGGNLDMNRFYGTADQWRAYAIGDNKAPEPAPAPQPTPAPMPEPEPQKPALTADEIAEAVANKLASRLKD